MHVLRVPLLREDEVEQRAARVGAVGAAGVADADVEAQRVARVLPAR